MLLAYTVLAGILTVVGNLMADIAIDRRRPADSPCLRPLATSDRGAAARRARVNLPPMAARGRRGPGHRQRLEAGAARVLRNRLAVFGLAVLVFFLLFCFVGPLVYHTNQTLINPLVTDLPPGGGHPLGTDENGFDELGRIMAGGQTALEVGFFAALIATVIGTLWGAIAGLAGRLLDGIMMRFVDMLLSIPFLFIVLVLATKFARRCSARACCWACSRGSSRRVSCGARC